MTSQEPTPKQLSDTEYLRIIRILEQTRSTFDQFVDVGQSDPAWNFVIFLIKSHVKRQPVSISILIREARIPYGTAQRRIHAMIDSGQIIKVYRGDSKKSFYLEPSPELFDKFTRYIRNMKTLLMQTVGARGEDEVDEYYFGRADFAQEIVPPAKLQNLLKEEKTELKFLLNDDNYFAAMRNMWADYRNNLGSRSSFSLKALPDLHTTLEKSLERKEPTFDVVSLNMPWLGEFAEKGHLRPLEEFITKDNIRPMDFDPTIWSTGRWDGKQYGIPIYVTVELMALRQDLFEERGLSKPRTFDQVIEIGRELHNPSKEFYGIAWNAARGMPIASSFMIMMGCCDSPIFNLPRGKMNYEWADLPSDWMRPRIDCEEAYIVLDYMQRLIEISPPDILEIDWNRRVSLFLNGEVGMAYCWSMRAVRFDQEVGSFVKRRTMFVPQPKGRFGKSVNPVGGFLIGIPSNISDRRAELAFEAISWMASPEAMKKHVSNGLPIAPRFSVASDPELAAFSPIVRYVDKLARRGMLRAWQRPPIPEYRQIENILGIRIHAALSGELTFKEALSLAQTEADQIMRCSGRY